MPAVIRRRWGTSVVLLEDQGDRLVVSPIPDDPVAALRGVFKDQLPPTEELRKIARRDEEAAQRRRA